MVCIENLLLSTILTTFWLSSVIASSLSSSPKTSFELSVVPIFDCCVGGFDTVHQQWKWKKKENLSLKNVFNKE